MRPIVLLQSTMPTYPASEHNRKVTDFLTRPKEKVEAPKRRSTRQGRQSAIELGSRGSPRRPLACLRSIQSPNSRLLNQNVRDDQSDITRILSGRDAIGFRTVGQKCGKISWLRSVGRIRQRFHYDIWRSLGELNPCFSLERAARTDAGRDRSRSCWRARRVSSGAQPAPSAGRCKARARCRACTSRA
jgi:hypothetical protein